MMILGQILGILSNDVFGGGGYFLCGAYARMDLGLRKLVVVQKVG